jgi:phosphotransferase system, enzyme I, PtsP
VGVSKDGLDIACYLNVGLERDSVGFRESGADGIGLVRTELAFLLDTQVPSLNRQQKYYHAVLQAAGDKPVCFRLFDLGGDKRVAWFRVPPEDNPMLGWRGMALLLHRPSLLRAQLSAMLQAAVGKELHILLPMVRRPIEVEQTVLLLKKIQDNLREQGMPIAASVKIGVMLEVPGLLFSLDRIRPFIDYLSVGTNDLLQYTFASARDGLYPPDPFAPSSLRLLKLIREEADYLDLPITVCGDMAAHPLSAMVLLALGYRRLSMPMANLGGVRQMIQTLDIGRVHAYTAALLNRSSQNLREQFRIYALDHLVHV